MKKILSIILITACLACGCSSASDTEKNASKSTASEPESIDFFAMDTTIKFSAYGDKKVLKGAKKVLTDLEKKVSVTDSGSEIYHINQNGSGTSAFNACRRLSWVDATQLFLCLNRQPSIRLCFHLQTHFFIQCNVILNEKII